MNIIIITVVIIITIIIINIIIQNCTPFSIKKEIRSLVWYPTNGNCFLFSSKQNWFSVWERSRMAWCPSVRWSSSQKSSIQGNMSQVMSRIQQVLTCLMPMEVANPGATLIPCSSGNGIWPALEMSIRIPASSVSDPRYSYCSICSSRLRPDSNKVDRHHSLNRSINLPIIHLSIHLHIPPSISLSLSLPPSPLPPPTHPPTHPSIYPPIHSSIHPSPHPPISPSLSPSLHPSSSPPARPSVLQYRSVDRSMGRPVDRSITQSNKLEVVPRTMGRSSFVRLQIAARFVQHIFTTVEYVTISIFVVPEGSPHVVSIIAEKRKTESWIAFLQKGLPERSTTVFDFTSMCHSTITTRN